MTNNPLQADKAITPFWMNLIHQFNGLEIHPCRTEAIEDEIRYIEPCGPCEAEFWSVYGHYKEGGVLCFEDFDNLPEARDFAERLLAAWPHLQVFGVLDFCG